MIAARKPTGTRASRRAPSTSEREHRRRVDDRVGVRHRDHRAEAAGGGGRRARCRCSPCTPGRACAGARAGRRTPGTACLPARVDRLAAVGRLGSDPGGAELGDLAVADQDVVRARRARCAGRARARRGSAARPGGRRRGRAFVGHAHAAAVVGRRPLGAAPGQPTSSS